MFVSFVNAPGAYTEKTNWPLIYDCQLFVSNLHHTGGIRVTPQFSADSLFAMAERNVGRVLGECTKSCGRAFLPAVLGVHSDVLNSLLYYRSSVCVCM